MKWQVIFLLTILILSFNLLIIRLNKVEVKAFDGYPVHNLDTGLNYTSIQESINAPETLDGHTVFVEEGTYYEHVIVSKSLTLLGEDKETTIIDGNMIGNVVRVTKDYVNIRGFTIQRSGQAYPYPGYSGIYVGSTQHCDISANYIVDNEYGVYGSPGNMSITDNIVQGNFLGVALDSGATNNVISRNHLLANNVSVHLNLADANYILQNNMTNNYRSVTLWESKNNEVYHNNFLNSTFAFGSVTAADHNFLDNGSEGNYWSNYTEVDLNHDGIGDSPYVIDENHTDHYPLMAAINFFDAGTWNDTTYYVNIVSNSTVSSFHFDPDEGAFASFWVKGETTNETIGFCRVAIPRNLLWVDDGWTVLYGSYPLSYKTFSDENRTYLYFTYTQYQNVSTAVTIYGTHTIPEFPSSFILSLFMIATLLTVSICRRKRSIVKE